MDKKALNVIGIMSGTSFDGVDCVLCKINPDLKYSVIAKKIYKYPLLIKKEIFKIIKGIGTIKELCELNFILGNFYAECAIKLCEENNFDMKDVDLISSHGQTVYHNPSTERLSGYSKNSTLQIGELSCIAKKTGVITVGDFRTCDMALGGQGAPLIPFFDRIIFSNKNKNLGIQNLGGIANITILGKNGEFSAFDNAPANALVDLAMRNFFNKEYDDAGQIGLSVPYNKEILNYIYEIDDFVKQPPPKSTGKEYYGEDFLSKTVKYKSVSNEIFIATLSAYTGFAIAKSIENFSPVKIDEIIISGGGVKNKAIIKYIKDFTKIKVSVSEDYGISNDFKEAVAFAILGYQRFFGASNNEPDITGAKEKTSMGKIVLP